MDNTEQVQIQNKKSVLHIFAVILAAAAVLGAVISICTAAATAYSTNDVLKSLLETDVSEHLSGSFYKVIYSFILFYVHLAICSCTFLSSSGCVMVSVLEKSGTDDDNEKKTYVITAVTGAVCMAVSALAVIAAAIACGPAIAGGIGA